MEIKNLKNRIPIIMPVYGQVEYTKKAVASLIKHTDPNLFECLIVDNASTDETPAFLADLIQRYPNQFRSVRLEKNLGFGGGVNKGLELLSSFKWQYGIIANNDLIFTPLWLEQMLETMESVKIGRIGIVGPMSNFAGGSQGMGANYKTAEELDKFASMHHQLNRGKWHEAGVVVGLLMLFRREFFDEVGCFDERFFPGTWEENDWELRGAIKGWKYVVDESTFIHHYGSKTLQSTEASKDQRKNFLTNRNRFREKWRGPDSPWEALAKERYSNRGQDPEQYKRPDGTYKKWVVAACRVKNGAQWLDMTLSRVSEFADEIVILIDQATTDNTQEICSRFSKVVALEKEPPHEYNESWSRNRVLQMAYDRHPDWVYVFDCDEVIEHRAVKQREELTDPTDPAVMLWIQPIIQLWNTNNTQRIDGLWGTFYQGRMFRVLPGQKIDNTNNLIHCGATPHVTPDRHGFSYFRIIHYGNVDPEVRGKKYEWYTKIDTDKDLGMALGAWREYYWKLYYGQPKPEDLATFDGKWAVIPDDPNWTRPSFGKFYSRDVYRHVKDETGLVLVPFDEKPIISLCMLVKDEAGFLPKAISSVRGFVNEIIVVDTGSTDGSDSIAEQLGAKVYHFDWVHDFSAARNFSLSKATGDWILRIDPDEIVPWETAIRLQELVRHPDIEGYVFPIMNWLQDPTQVRDPKWALSETCRLYKNLYPTVKYSNPVHEELDDDFKKLAEKRGERVRVAKVPYAMYHYGYLRDHEFKEKKFNYYYELGKRHMDSDPNDPRPFFNMAVHCMHVGNYREALEKYKKAIELDPKNHLALNDVGVLLSSVVGDYEGAEKFFKQALKSMDSNTHPTHRERVEKNLEELRMRLLTKTISV